MGADFLVAIAPMEATEDEALTNLGALSDKTVQTAVGDVLGLDDMTPEEARDRAVTAIYEIVGADRSDVDWVQAEGRIYVTGGMSWGDSPTEAFDEVALLGALGITRRQEASCGESTKEDSE